jgi:hypothetical protein
MCGVEKESKKLKLSQRKQSDRSIIKEVQKRRSDTTMKQNARKIKRKKINI